MNNELKPCPFCGNKVLYVDDIYEGDERRLYVSCHSCGAMSPWNFKQGRCSTTARG